MRRLFRLIVPSVLLALLGCTQVYTTAPGGGPLQHSATYLTLPYTGTQPVYPAQPRGTAFGHDGTYAGDAQALNSAGAQCSAFMRSNGFQVEGRRVAFGPFRGRIADNGELKMIYGQNTIVGRFIGNEFRGVIDFQTPPCSYAMRLRRTGPG